MSQSEDRRQERQQRQHQDRDERKCIDDERTHRCPLTDPPQQGRESKDEGEGNVIDAAPGHHHRHGEDDENPEPAVLAPQHPLPAAAADDQHERQADDHRVEGRQERVPQCATEVIRNERERDSHRDGERSVEPRESQGQIRQHRYKRERDEDQHVDASESGVEHGVRQPGKEVLRDVNAGEVIEIHPEGEAKVRGEPVGESAPRDAVGVCTCEVTPGPGHVELAQDRPEHRNGHRRCEQSGDDRLQRRAPARHHVSRVRHACPSVTWKALAGFGAQGKS